MATAHSPILVRILVSAAIVASFAFVLDRTPGESLLLPTTTTTYVISDCFPACRLIVRLDDSVSIGAIQFRADYSQTDTSFFGDGTAVECTALTGDFSAFNHRVDEQALDGAIISIAGVNGPLDLASCGLTLCPNPFQGEIGVFPTDASGPDLVAIFPLPSISATIECDSLSTTTTTLSVPICGAPITGRTPPVSTDVLRILRAAIGLDACDPCACDVDSNGTVDARDARRTLLESLGLGDGLVCPGC